jgi:hypothetical protein
MADSGLRATVMHTLVLWADVGATLSPIGDIIDTVDWLLSVIWTNWDDSVDRIRHQVTQEMIKP